MPVRLETDGLESGLIELAEHAQRIFGVACYVEGCDARVPVDANAALHIYRIAQEALNNAFKHGHASKVTIGLGVESGDLTLVVTDDGCGFSTGGEPSSGMGLGIMRYRARMVGGTLSVDSDPGQGTTVTCRFPASTAD